MMLYDVHIVNCILNFRYQQQVMLKFSLHDGHAHCLAFASCSASFRKYFTAVSIPTKRLYRQLVVHQFKTQRTVDWLFMEQIRTTDNKCNIVNFNLYCQLPNSKAIAIATNICRISSLVFGPILLLQKNTDLPKRICNNSRTFTIAANIIKKNIYFFNTHCF